MDCSAEDLGHDAVECCKKGTSLLGQAWKAEKVDGLVQKSMLHSSGLSQRLLPQL